MKTITGIDFVYAYILDIQFIEKYSDDVDVICIYYLDRNYLQKRVRYRFNNTIINYYNLINDLINK